jgi:hypothetical protein
MKKVPIVAYTVFLGILSIVSFTFCNSTDNQGIIWQKMYGGINRDDPSTIIAHPDSGYVVVSSRQYRPNLSNIWLLRLGSKGDTLWTKSYGDSLRNELPVHLDIIPDGYIITGCIQDASTEKNAWLIKCDRNGDTVWTRIYHKKNATSSCITTDSAIVLTGQADTMLFLMKVSSSGDSVFCKKLGDKSQNLFGNAIVQTFDSGFIIGGQTKTASSKPSIIVYKFNNKGDSLWARTSTPANGSMGNDIVQLPDGSILLAGSRSSTNSGNTKSFLQLRSASGDSIWEKISGDDTLNETIQKIVAVDKGYICTAGTRVGSNNATIIVRGFTTNGEPVASREFGNFSSTQTINFCKDAILSPKGSIVIASFTQPEQGGQTLLFEVAYANGMTRLVHPTKQYHPVISTPEYFNLLGKKMSSQIASCVFCSGPVLQTAGNSIMIISGRH